MFDIFHDAPFTKAFVIAALATAITGCGGGSSSSSDSSGPQVSPIPAQEDEASTAGQIDVADYGSGVMDEAALESIVTESYRILTEIAWSNTRYVELIDVVAESDLGEEIARDAIDLSAFLCPGGGQGTLSFDNGRPREAEDGFLVFSAGDRFTLAYNSCEFSGYEDPLMQEGSATTTVEAGFHDAFGEFVSLNGTVSTVYNAVGLRNGNETLSYRNGDIRRGIENGSDVFIKGSSLKVQTPTQPALAFALQDYELQLIETGDSSIVREWTMSAPSSFGLGIGETGEIYQARLDNVVLSESASWLTAGSYTLLTDSRTLEITIENGFLNYQADLDGDGSSDIAASVAQP
ncbi:hypothetical protein C9974_12145 [Marinobacter sp. B9-2]|nr:hypothetical protein C9974_12145 [Marinobacter sp. B9-2]